MQVAMEGLKTEKSGTLTDGRLWLKIELIGKGDTVERGVRLGGDGGCTVQGAERL